MTIKDRFLKQWRKNFEEFTPPELKILHLELPERDSVTSTSSEGNSEVSMQKLNALQEDLEHTHEIIFKIRNELKQAKFCQSWLQREFTRCRKHSESIGSITTPEASGSDLDEEEADTAFVEHDEQDAGSGTGSQEGDVEEDGEEEPLYMNVQDAVDQAGIVVPDDSDSDHDYEYLYDNTPFSNSHAGRMPPPIPQENGRSGSPDIPEHREPPATPPPDYSMSRTYSIDKPGMTTADRLTRPTLAIPEGMDHSMPAQLMVEAQKKRFSQNFSNLSPIEMEDNTSKYSLDAQY